ncbi:hypothetical protein [Mesorhizobium sp.]|uniref:hypothetical protein n=1 Tax=Mesorhizobium sp. TaxID=1871066 RepID=UPI000FE3CD5C|nr:hypothetical protein [Mesorhizobium sp.]RWH66145.1 MAG: hypothetical protein EOQ84_31710 [Mesorhizobium sp.]RWL20950.1 MAG: hypothetical protein EOR58_30540 [Mesorhizobium sp.]RWL23972.1 MAG: hypothetical protein EOR63_31315 [Mesorhizobium sp.]RWL28177.1 MAG: hypothetical protein EOR59_31520 [Mesorhizobium sp.]RWL43927.1 MAG: hypothetical protein EOR62_32205 [Mesorhizobium sp.]
MADSDHSMTLPHVTQSRLLPAAPHATAEKQSKPIASSDSRTDTAVAVWRDWQEAHFETERLSHENKRLERELAETVGFPRATIPLPDGTSMKLRSLEALHQIRDIGQVDAATCAKAEADLAAHETRWNSADQNIGYTATLLAEAEAAARSEALLYLLSQTPATSLEGIAGKLDAALREGQTSPEDAEPPWPQIRSALKDIARLGHG